MAELRIDVEARNARTQLEATARSVDRISDELVDLEMASAAAENAFNDAAREARRLEGEIDDTARSIERLEGEIRSMDAAFGDSTDLRRQLEQAQDSARDLAREMYQVQVAGARAEHEFDRAEHQIDQMTVALRAAEHEANRLERTLDDLDVRAGSMWSRMRRGAIDFGDDVRDGSRRALTGMREFIRSIPGELRAGLIGAGLLIAPILAPLIGAGLNGAILAGLGGGVLALGIVRAVKDPQVAGAFKPLGQAMLQTLTAGTESFKPKLVELAGIFQKSWKTVGPQVFNMLNELQHAIVPLGTGVARMFENMAPGLRQFLSASVPILKDLGRQLSWLGTNLGQMFKELARDPKTIEGAMRGLRTVMVIVSGTAVLLGQALGALARWFVDITNRAEALFRVLSHLPGVGGFFERLANNMAAINDNSSQMGRSLTGNALSLGGYSTAAQNAANATMALSQQMTTLFGLTMGVDQATLQWNQSVMALNESLKENGRSTDQSTQKGLANVQAILAAVQAAEQMRQASIEAAGGQNASAEAIDTANAAYRRQLDQLAATMRQAGMTEGQIQALLGSYYQIASAPNVYKTITVERKVLGPALGPEYGYRGFAVGTRAAPPGMAWVGERGPELVYFRGGERVFTAAESARLAGATSATRGTASDPGRSGGGRTVALTVAAGGDRMVADFITKLVRTGVLRLA